MEDYKFSALIPLAHQQPACVQTSIHIYIKLCLIKNLKITMWKDTKPKKTLTKMFLLIAVKEISNMAVQ